MSFRFINTPSQDNTGRVATYLQQEVPFNPSTGVVKLTPTAQHNLIEVTGINDNINLDVTFEGKEGDELTVIFYALTSVIISLTGLFFPTDERLAELTQLGCARTILKAVYLGNKGSDTNKGWYATSVTKFNAFA
jgi:hypothetical protein